MQTVKQEGIILGLQGSSKMFTSTHSFSLNAPLIESNAGMWRFHVNLGRIHKHMHCVKERVFLFETSALLGALLPASQEVVRMKGVDLGRERRELKGGKVKSVRCRAYKKVLSGKLTAALPAAKNRTEEPLENRNQQTPAEEGAPEGHNGRNRERNEGGIVRGAEILASTDEVSIRACVGCLTVFCACVCILPSVCVQLDSAWLRPQPSLQLWMRFICILKRSSTCHCCFAAPTRHLELLRT